MHIASNVLVYLSTRLHYRYLSKYYIKMSRNPMRNRRVFDDRSGIEKGMARVISRQALILVEDDVDTSFPASLSWKREDGRTQPTEPTNLAINSLFGQE